MNVNHHQTKRERSYFEWGDKMQIIRKGKGEIAMTESELVSFFSVAWRKLNYSLQLLLKAYPLQPEERAAGEVEVFVNGRLRGYAPLYPLSIFQSLSLCPINWTAWKHICSGTTSAKSYNTQHLW